MLDNHVSGEMTHFSNWPYSSTKEDKEIVFYEVLDTRAEFVHTCCLPAFYGSPPILKIRAGTKEGIYRLTNNSLRQRQRAKFGRKV